MANTKTQQTATTKAPAKKTIKITDDMIVNVKSLVFGTLTYIDKRTGEEVKWENEGEIQQVSYSLLRSMKASQADFYKNNWIVLVSVEDNDDITPEELYKALYVQQYYKNIIDPDNFATVCNWSEKEIEDKVPFLTKNGKANLTVALNTYIENGTLDSLRKIKAFEKALDCSLAIPEH